MHGDDVEFMVLVGLLVFATGWGVVASWIARRIRRMWEAADAEAQQARAELRRVSEHTMARHKARAAASVKGWRTRKQRKAQEVQHVAG